MQKKADGQNYAPKGVSKPVCSPGDFPVGIIGLDHGHIYGMCNGLQESGASIDFVYDPDPEKVATFLARFPDTRVARSEQEILEHEKIKLVASASVPEDRTPLGIRAMQHGKDFFADKPPCTTKTQIQEARTCVAETGMKFGVYYSERLHVEAATRATQLIQDGAIGRIVQVMGWGPHRAAIHTRPAWFFDKNRYGGILVDIGCHQIEQILSFSGSEDGTVTSSRIANYHHAQYPNFFDFGDATLTTDTGCAGYFRVDWFTPNGLGTWGDGRTIVLGTDGYIELRKYLDIARDPEGDHVYLVNHEGEHHECVAGKAGFPFFGQFVRDCLDRTDRSMNQDLVFRAIELAVEAENSATNITEREG
ncbi:MAG TPA: Gfo/Idh/MocA family oxidoreductase [Sphaerochaetaceae bacterium]|nr:Gfo/Idh/MocA family oxidoreductase [Sphaerochaetaceae bacterium]